MLGFLSYALFLALVAGLMCVVELRNRRDRSHAAATIVAGRES